MGIQLQNDVINVFRSIADDTVPPYDWSDDELQVWAQEAEDEAARRTRMLRDSSSSVAYALVLGTGVQFLTLDPRIIYIKRVHLASKSWALVKKHKSDLDTIFPGWDLPGTNNLNLGDINHYCLDHDSGQIWFDSPSPVADTVYLTVIRTPLMPMSLEIDKSILVTGSATQTMTTTGTNTVFGTNTWTVSSIVTSSADSELPLRYKYSLMQWLIFRAYEKQDSETNDPEKSAAGLAKFEAEFGVKRSAQDEQYMVEQYGYDPDDGSY